MKTVLITGGAGFVGNALAQKLKSTHDVHVLDDFSSSSHHPVYEMVNEGDRILYDGITYTRGHTSNITSLMYDISPEIVFHFGEFSRINESWHRKEQVYKSNLLGTSAVLDFCVDKKSFLVYSASSAILSSEPNSLQSTPYTFTKSVMVSMVKHYAEWYGLKYVITYFYNVYGPGQICDGPYSTVMGIYERCCQTNTNFPVVLPGTQRRIFTHINDIIDGIVLSLSFENKEIPIASKDEISIIDLARQMKSSLASSNAQLHFLPSRKGDRQHSVKILPDLLAQSEWKPQESLYEYIYKVRQDAMK